MDSLTHIVVGACMGDVMTGKKLGKRAMFLGAVAQSVPDIDFIASFWMKMPEELLAHRGFTHSILFAIFITGFLGLLAERLHRKHNISLRIWFLFFGVEIFMHLFLDLFNSYGTGLFMPFSDARISLNTLFVADPFFSLWPAIAFVALLILKRRDKRRAFWQRVGLGISSIYLLYCSINKLEVKAEIKKELKEQAVTYKRLFTTPTPLNNWLWYIVAEDDKGYYIGYYSVFDKNPQIDLHYFFRNDKFLKPVSDHESIMQLKRFSKGFYTVEKWQDTLMFNDLRFGQIVGWHNPNEKFVFHYYLTHPNENQLVVQRGRFSGWNKQTFAALVQRIRGN